MSAPRKIEGGPALFELAELVEALTEAIVAGDAHSALEAHSAIGRGLHRATHEPSVVVDLARERQRRGPARRR